MAAARLSIMASLSIATLSPARQRSPVAEKVEPNPRAARIPSINTTAALCCAGGVSEPSIAAVGRIVGMQSISTAAHFAIVLGDTAPLRRRRSMPR